MPWPLFLLAAVLLAANLVATVVVLRSELYSGPQRALQLALVWLLPVLGAIVCVVFATTQSGTGSPGPAAEVVGPDFYGLSGGEGNGDGHG